MHLMVSINTSVSQNPMSNLSEAALLVCVCCIRCVLINPSTDLLDVYLSHYWSIKTITQDVAFPTIGNPPKSE